MRKTILRMIMFAALFFITACGGIKTKTVDLIEYVDVYFDGMSTVGHADYTVDIHQAVLDVYGWEADEFEENMIELQDKKPEVATEINNLFESYSIELDKADELANGDQVTVKVTVDEESSFAFNGGEKQFTVDGLEEPEVLTEEEVQKHIVVDFIGANERGFARINNTFSGDLNNISFDIENSGQLSNGDEAKLIINEEETPLINFGYRLDDNFNVTYEVKDLAHYPKTVDEIKNLKDINRMINEEMEKNFPNKRSFDFETRFKVKEETTLYRQFTDDEPQDADISRYGAYIKLYTIKRYFDKEAYDADDPSETYVYARGYTNIHLDENGKVNVTQMDDFTEYHDESYSLETVQQTYEGYGFEVVKTK